MIKEASFWHGNGKIKCYLCPHGCVIPKGKRGICGVRENRDGKLYTLIHSLCSSVYPDPIEKKPLFHFHPGTTALSLGTVGCNLKCLYCQNYTISQAKPEDHILTDVPPEEAVKKAKEYGCEGIAWTYNEPTIWWEYTYDSAKIAKREGLYTVYVTNGFAGKDAIKEISPYLDAANVDIKAMNEEFYKKICKARLQPVLDACKMYKEMEVHLEITYLVIPGRNDSEKEIKKFSKWVIDEIGNGTPTHFSAFYPHYRMMDVPPTPMKTLLRAYDIAKSEGLDYIYIGNVPHGQYENTFCPACENKIIERYGFSAKIVGLKDGKCTKCGKKMGIIV
ncbi:MAG: AmmeMemoRadiSam system radical SAM enzyme [Candidatus Thermoplasmatota archaeon]|nr:AmmeMemoRadiSam system radical SAM enzyme [Candidatus Thermoplasmatota archaeon]